MIVLIRWKVYRGILFGGMPENEDWDDVGV